MMTEWWESLSKLNQGFYCAAAFFGVLFIWQLLGAILGLDGDDADVDAAGDVDVDGTYDDFEHGAEVDSSATLASFKLVSIRSLVTFFTLFTLGGALYMDRGDTTARSLGYSTAWGLAGMLAVAGIVYLLRKMTHTGTKNLATSVGATGSVYLNIPEGGTGEIRVMVSGILSNVKAKNSGGKALKQGTPVKVKRRLDNQTVEVDELEKEGAGE
jgi:hypothetical protein